MDKGTIQAIIALALVIIITGLGNHYIDGLY